VPLWGSPARRTRQPGAYFLAKGKKKVESPKRLWGSLARRTRQPSACSGKGKEMIESLKRLRGSLARCTRQPGAFCLPERRIERKCCQFQETGVAVEVSCEMHEAAWCICFARKQGKGRERKDHWLSCQQPEWFFAREAGGRQVCVVMLVGFTERGFYRMFLTVMCSILQLQ